MRTILLALFVILFLSGCGEKSVDFAKDVHKLYKDKYSGSRVKKTKIYKQKKKTKTSKQTKYSKNRSYSTIIRDAEKNATPQARRVLATVRKMVKDRVIIRGACWDYLDRAFTKAGYPRNRRAKIFRSKKRGSYARASMLKAGDWVYHINYSYHNIEHSGMFIGWINYRKKIGLMLSYAGERRREPGRYKAYNLSGVYNIMRAK